ENGTFSACQPVTATEHEVCNGADDDCDGVADNNIPPPTCLGECAVVSGCNNGLRVDRCQPGASVDSCSTGNTGTDDDCNGIIDDGCVSACVWASPSGLGTGTTHLDPMSLDGALMQAASSPD